MQNGEGGVDPPTRWGRVALYVAAGVIAAFQVGKVPAALPAIRAEMVLGFVAGGFVASIFNLISALSGVAVGATADRVGHERMMIAGLMTLCLGGVLSAMAPVPSLLLAGRFFEGIGFVTATVSAPSLIIAVTARSDQRLALSFWSTYMPTGFSAMMLASPWLMVDLGWRGTWLANAILVGLVTGFILRTTLRSPLPAGPPKSPQPLRDLKQAFSVPAPWAMGGAFGLYTTQWFAITSWLPTFLVDAQGHSLNSAAAFGALVVLVNVPGNLLGGWFLSRGAPRWLLIAVSFVVMGGCGLGLFAGEVPAMAKYGLALAFSFLGGMLPASLLAAVPVLSPSPNLVGAFNGAIVQGANIGTFLGPPLLGALVATYGGWQESGWLMPAAGLAGLAVTAVLATAERRQ